MTQVIKGSGGGCFPAGVLVYTPDRGQIPIEQLKLGDKVISFTETGELKEGTITEIVSHPSLEVHKVNYWGGSIRITLNHWVLNQFGAFAEIGYMTEKDALVDSLGHLRPVGSKELEGIDTVYNLTVEPHHTFIADNIRVHNGGLGLKHPVIGSGGGGSKGGGGRTPVESPDSLQSKQFAKVLDLVSEGEIEGLVNGAQSIFLNSTPLQNPDGTFNFTGFQYEDRLGTQNQSPITGFNTVESEQSVGTEVIFGAPVVRSITDETVTHARVTISIPSLAKTNVTNGDVTGSSVTLAIYLQSAGGPFLPVNLNYVIDTAPLIASGNHAYMGQVGSRADLTVTWYTDVAPQTQYITFRLERSIIGSGIWTPLLDKTMTGSASTEQLGWEHEYQSNYVPSVITFNYTDEFSSSPQQYEYRVVTLYKSLAGISDATLSGNYNNTGSWSPQDTISGKSSSRYQRSYLFPLTGSAPWNIKVERVSPDAPDQYTQNKTVWDSFTEVTDVLLNYPNSALVGVSVDASQFSSIPTRGYLLRGLKVQVPTNYDPVTRVYSGIWDGTFKVAWTDNPAWCFYDIIVNNRYGLGEYVSSQLIDLTTLYQISKYCDELVPNGYGGQEPRYTCNLYLQTREDAYKVLVDMASIFSGMVFWASGVVSFTYDHATEPVALFNNSNVIDGEFVYQGTSRSSRHTVALVTYNDPEDSYRQKVEYVEDFEGIAKYGIKEVEYPTLGCTSRGQAHRLGKRILLTERYLTETVTFATGMEGVYLYPGAVISVYDNSRTQVRNSGRIKSATTTTITLDAPVTLELGMVYTVAVYDMSLNTPVERVVSTPAGTDISVLTLAEALPNVPVSHSLWTLSYNDIKPQLYQVVTAAERDKVRWEVTALQYDTGKYDAIDFNTVFTPEVRGNKFNTTPTVQSVNVVESLYLIPPSILGTRAHVSWDADTSGTISKYVFSWRYQGENWNTLPEDTTPTAVINDIEEGKTLEMKVTSFNFVGITSVSSVFTHTVLGKQAPPSQPANVTAVIQLYDILIKWDPVPDLDLAYYEVRVGTSWDEGTVVSTRSTATSVIHDQSEQGNYIYHVAAFDTSGNRSLVASVDTGFLSKPADVTGFDVIQNNNQISFIWDEIPSTQVDYYEIREGSGWTAGRVVTQTFTNTHKISTNAFVGTRTFWIKAIKRPGIYSQNAVFSFTAVAESEDTNLLHSTSQEALGWSGSGYGYTIVGDDLHSSAVEMDYSYPVSLPQEFRARNSIVDSVGVLLSSPTWAEISATWAEATAERWLNLADLELNIKYRYYLATKPDAHPNAGYFEEFSLNNTLVGAYGTTAIASASIAYAPSGRYLSGLNISPLTFSRWNNNLPNPAFSVRFTARLVDDVTPSQVLWQGYTSDSKSITISISPATKQLHCYDDFGQSLSLDYSTLPIVDNVFDIVLDQTGSSRTIGMLATAESFVETSNTYTPIGVLINTQLG